MSNADHLLLLSDSILPMALQNERFTVLEKLLVGLKKLPKHIVISNVDMVDDSTLNYYADNFSLFSDGWEFTKSKQEKRALIKSAIEIHKHKGTPWAIKRTLNLLGYGDCELEERHNIRFHNSIHRHNRKIHYGESGQWTHYRLIMQSALSITEAERIRALLKDVAPLRCKLVGIKTPRLIHDGVITHGGRHNYNGEISWQN